MSRPDANTFYMVVEDQRLVGVISLKDLREIIAMKLKMREM
jgi:CBS domain-containing protein